MCKYRPRFFVGYKSLATCKRSETERQRDDWTDRKTHFIELSHLHPGPKKQAERLKRLNCC